MKNKINVLVFFDGGGGVSFTAKELGFNVKTLDILKLDHIDLPIDIMDFNPSMLPGFIPDVIWASPPCETFSILTAMKGGGNMYWETIKTKGLVSEITPRANFMTDKRLKFPERITEKRIQHSDFVNKTIKIINHYEIINPNLIWFVENPATGFMKHYITKLKYGIVVNKTTYCKYGAMYRKETNIFSNISLDLKWCPRKYKNNNNDCHHTDSFSLRWDKNKQTDGVVIPKTYLERSTIPKDLCVDILLKAKRELTFVSHTY